MKIKKYFAYNISAEGKIGITDNWEECRKIVSGKPNAKYKGFKTKKEAEDWLAAGADYSLKKAMEPGIYFDSGTGRGDVEASVTDEKGNNLLTEIIPKNQLNKFGKYHVPGRKTNNYGELLAVSLALKIADRTKVKKIFGDSKLVINYWSKGFARTKNVSEETMKLVKEVSILREKFEKDGGRIGRISGDDNPADLGFHR